MTVKFDLSSSQNYRASGLKMVSNLLNTWCAAKGRKISSLTIDEVKKNLSEISQYPRLQKLRFKLQPGDIQEVSTQSLSTESLDLAKETYLTGGVLTENTAGGEATRLGMGSKYVLTPKDLLEGLNQENIERKNKRQPALPAGVKLEDLLPLSLGTRHMLQYAYDLIQLAEGTQRSYHDVLKSQFILMVLNENNYLPVIREMVKYNFFGFDSTRMLFMVQNVYPGIEIVESGVRFSPRAPWRLWNHGDIVMTSTMDNQIFGVRFNIFGEIKKNPLTADQFGEVLKSTQVKICYPIEDIPYLTGSISIPNTALALESGKEGYRMLMEVVGQKENEAIPFKNFKSKGVSEKEIKRCLNEGLLVDLGNKLYRFNPGIIPPGLSPALKELWEQSIRAQKGGFWGYDPELERGGMIESDQGGKVIDNAKKDTLTQIQALNKNFNLFPYPYDAWAAVKKYGLMAHIDVKDGFLYLSPPQGDQNFLVSTAFIQKTPPQPISNLKERADIPAILQAMKEQDSLPGWRQLAGEFGIIPTPEGKFVFPQHFVSILNRLEPLAKESPHPLSLEEFNLPMFLEPLTTYAQEHLRAAFEICEVVGSLVRRYQVKGQTVYLETIPETMKGEGKKYPSQAMSQVVASDSKARIARDSQRIFVDKKHGQVIIDIPNQQSPHNGEIITLLVKVKEGIPPEKIKELFAGKIRMVLERIADTGIDVKKTKVQDKAKKLFLNMPLEDIFVKRVDKIAEEIAAKLKRRS